MSHEPTHSEAINTFCDANRILNEIEDRGWGRGTDTQGNVILFL